MGMFVSGFTFIRNAEKFDYPIVEAIRSILPLCDECIVAVGRSEDNTRGLIEGMQEPKIRIIDTVWDDTLREGGRVLAEETNKALAAVSAKADWAIYIQADECMHEEDRAEIRAAMLQYRDDTQVEGFLFKYRHFYGSYDYIATSRKWYRHEVRIVRPKPGLSSYRDAQGFRHDGRKLRVKPLQACIYHYGWVKHPKLQQAKQQYFHKLWHPDEWLAQNVSGAEAFDYSGIDRVECFTGKHPEAIASRIARINWSLKLDTGQNRQSLKYRVLEWLERWTGRRWFEYRNYELLK
jgi:hypothetical protein